MPRIVALDVGDATIGVAATDELNIAVHAIRTIQRTKSVKADLGVVQEALEELDACKVIVGLPVNLDGGDSAQTKKVREFSERLARRLRIPVEHWDERYSTVEAEASLLDIDVSRAKRKKVIDKMAACVILESYLSNRS